jgi:pimeloyl-ACP methyl ester carboxylesterase
MPDASVSQPPPGSIFYLHGFASSARSTKASYLADRFMERGLTLQSPDFNEPDFATLTVTRMLERLNREIGDGPAALIGSSLGGALAILAASAFGPRVDRIVLLAPAVMFAKEGHYLLPSDRIDEWRRSGQLAVFHYADRAERMLNFAFYEDSFRYNPFDTQFAQPALVFQGRHDTAVDPAAVERFARRRPNVTLHLLDDDHQMIRSLPRIWEGISTFLEVP